jgi:hypothetical protein
MARLRSPYLLKMGSASRQFSQTASRAPNGKTFKWFVLSRQNKTNAQAARHAWKICAQTLRERLFWAICCVAVLAKSWAIGGTLRLAVGRHRDAKVSSSAQRVSQKRLARAICQLIRTSLVESIQKHTHLALGLLIAIFPRRFDAAFVGLDRALGIAAFFKCTAERAPHCGVGGI